MTAMTTKPSGSTKSTLEEVNVDRLLRLNQWRRTIILSTLLRLGIFLGIHWAFATDESHPGLIPQPIRSASLIFWLVCSPLIGLIAIRWGRLSWGSRWNRVAALAGATTVGVALVVADLLLPYPASIMLSIPFLIVVTGFTSARIPVSQPIVDRRTPAIGNPLKE